MKKFSKILLSLMIAIVFIVPITLSGCGKNVEASSATVVVKSITETLEKTMNKIASGASERISEEDIEEKEDQVSSTSVESFSNCTVNDYIRELSVPAGFLYAIQFIVENSVAKENEYSNAFDYGVTYAGDLSIDTFNVDYAVIRVDKDVENEKVNLKMDLQSNNEYVNITVNVVVDYDFENDNTRKLSFVLLETKRISNFIFAEFDFLNNEFSSLKLQNWHLSGSKADSILSDFDNGLITYQNLPEYGTGSFTFLTANITENYDRLRLLGYDIYIGDNDVEIRPNLTARALFNQIYNKSRKMSIRVDNIDTKDAKIVTYIKDAGNYGENKATVWTSTFNGKQVFSYTFIEYEDMINYLSQAKTIITGSNEYSSTAKQIISSAYGFINEWGKVGYTMQLGTWGGVTTHMYVGMTYIYDEDYNWTGKWNKYVEISNESRTFRITFDVNGNTVSKIYTSDITNKKIYDTCVYNIENKNYESTSTEYQFLMSLKNYCGDNNNLFEESTNWYIKNIGSSYVEIASRTLTTSGGSKIELDVYYNQDYYGSLYHFWD